VSRTGSRYFSADRCFQPRLHCVDSPNDQFQVILPRLMITEFGEGRFSLQWYTLRRIVEQRRNWVGKCINGDGFPGRLQTNVLQPLQKFNKLILTVYLLFHQHSKVVNVSQEIKFLCARSGFDVHPGVRLASKAQSTKLNNLCFLVGRHRSKIDLKLLNTAWSWSRIVFGVAGADPLRA